MAAHLFFFFYPRSVPNRSLFSALTICFSIRRQSLLDEPNPNSPANSLAAQLYQENRREYEKRVAAIVEQSWLNFAEDDDGDAEAEPAT